MCFVRVQRFQKKLCTSKILCKSVVFSQMESGDFGLCKCNNFATWCLVWNFNNTHVCVCVRVCVCAHAPMCVCVTGERVQVHNYDDEGGWFFFFVLLCIVVLINIHLSLNFLDEQCIICMDNFASHIDILLLATSDSLGMTHVSVIYWCTAAQVFEPFWSSFFQLTFSWWAYHMIMWVFWIDVIIITCAIHTVGYIWW